MEREKGEVWIFAEQEDGVLNDVALELLGKGRELADVLGVPLAAVLLGSGVEGLAAKLFEHGADKVRLVDDPALKNFGILGTLWHHDFGQDMLNIYLTLANSAWNAGGETSYLRGMFHHHLRQIGWDMKNTDPKRAGIFREELPEEPVLNN